MDKFILLHEGFIVSRDDVLAIYYTEEKLRFWHKKKVFQIYIDMNGGKEMKDCPVCYCETEQEAIDSINEFLLLLNNQGGE